MSSTQASNEQPRYFYKYGCVDDERDCHTKRIFEANELYFSTIDKFNDPFDCSHVLRASGPRKKVREYFNKLHQENKPHLNREKRRISVNDFMKMCKPSNESVSFEGLEEFMEMDTNKWRVYCLSETCENIQMWAHYADGRLHLPSQFGPIVILCDGSVRGGIDEAGWSVRLTGSFAQAFGDGRSVGGAGEGCRFRDFPRTA